MLFCFNFIEITSGFFNLFSVDIKHALPIVSCRVVSCRVVSCRVVSCRVVSCRVVSCRAVPCRAVPCRAVPCRAVPCRAVSCRIVLFSIEHFRRLKCKKNQPSFNRLHEMYCSLLEGFMISTKCSKVCVNYCIRLSNVGIIFVSRVNSNIGTRLVTVAAPGSLGLASSSNTNIICKNRSLSTVDFWLIHPTDNNCNN